MPRLNDAQAWVILGALIFAALVVIAWCMEDPDAEDPPWVQQIGQRLDGWFSGRR